MIGTHLGALRKIGAIALLGLVFIAGVLWHLENPSQVYACSCLPPGTPLEELEESAAVFAGRVVSIHEHLPSMYEITVGFEVREVWKGNVHETMFVVTSIAEPTCGFPFDLLGEYIAYGHDGLSVEGAYTVSLCTRTARLGDAQADLDALGPGNPPLPGIGGPDPAQSEVPALPNTGGFTPPVWTLVLAAGIAAVAAATGFAQMVRGRRGADMTF